MSFGTGYFHEAPFQILTNPIGSTRGGPRGTQHAPSVFGQLSDSSGSDSILLRRYNNAQHFQSVNDLVHAAE